MGSAKIQFKHSLEKLRKSSVRIPGYPANIRTGYLPTIAFYSVNAWELKVSWFAMKEDVSVCSL